MVSLFGTGQVPMLGVVFSLVFAYALCHCSVIVFAGIFTEIVQNYLNWNEKSKGAFIL